MAHFAQLDEDNNVIQVIVVSNDDVQNFEFPESEPVGVAFCQSLFGKETIWKQTSYNGKFRKLYAPVGGFYDANLDIFVISKPSEHLMYNNQTGDWEPTIPKPENIPDGYVAIWDIKTLNWVVVRSDEERKHG